MVDQRCRRFIANGAVWSDLVVVFEPIFYFSMCVVKAHEPVRVQAFTADFAVKGFDECVVGWLARTAEVQRNAVGVSPQIKVARDELAALVNADCLWVLQSYGFTA